MTRAEFIHRAVLEGMRTNAEDGQPIGKESVLLWAYSLADAIEKDGKALWSDPDDTAILKRIDHEAFQRGYAMGTGDGRKYAAEEANTVVTVEGRDGRLVEKVACPDIQRKGSGDFSIGSNVWPGTFVVKYKVTGFDGERTTEAYPTEIIARQHADDIRTYEGVEYAVVEPAK